MIFSLKKHINLLLLMLSSSIFLAQTDGLTYQAVIINPEAQEIPGRDTQQILSDASIALKFSIIENGNTTVFIEEHQTKTDVFGMVHLVIGSGAALQGNFNEIHWGGLPMELQVEINFGKGYTFLSKENLTYIPYAMHRNIIATGDLNVAGLVDFEGDLTVDGTTDLNSTVRVNNGSPTLLSGSLSVAGISDLQNNVNVAGNTTLQNNLTVANGAQTSLTGDLTVEGNTQLQQSLSVGGTTTLEDNLTVSNGANSHLSGNLTVEGQTTLEDNLTLINGASAIISGNLQVSENTNLQNQLTVLGNTTLQNNLSVLNGSPTHLSGDLQVDGNTTLNGSVTITNNQPLDLSGDLTVAGNTSLQQNLTVNENTTLNDELTVNGNTTLTGTLEVNNNTVLQNTLIVDGSTTLNNGLEVANNSNTLLTGNLTVNGSTNLTNDLNVSGASTLQNGLTVANAAATNLSGNLTVEGQTTLEKEVTINGATTINNDLTVTRNTTLNQLRLNGLNLSSDQANFVASIENTNNGNGDGLVIKLGRTHGAWNNGSYLYLTDPAQVLLANQLTTVKGWLNGGSFSAGDIAVLMPTTVTTAGFAFITNAIIDQVNNGLGLPIGLPEIAIPRTTLLPRTNIFGGLSMPSPIPDIPSITIPAVVFPRTVLLSAQPNLIPAIPTIPTSGLYSITIPNFSASVVNNSLTKENQYVAFHDKDDRQVGVIRAQSTQDFRDNNLLSDIRVLNIMSSFVGVDLLDGVVSGTIEISNLIYDFNRIGVEYASGHGDYAEWLPRQNPSEAITAGDIVGIKGGKISKDLNDFEQLMVVSHKPIVLGNTPEKGKEHLGNNVAFMGQVPVKIMGAVKSGDYIIAHETLAGYGKAIAPQDMTTEDFKNTVGRSWETHPQLGPKTVNTVVGMHNGDWVKIMQKIQQKHQALENRVEQLDRLANQLLSRQ